MKSQLHIFIAKEQWYLSFWLIYLDFVQHMLDEVMLARLIQVVR